ASDRAVVQVDDADALIEYCRKSSFFTEWRSTNKLIYR
ncbi:MAG: hypothetical protein ACI9HX_000669, partial [Pseudoalteromonas tetraodonis]